MTVEPSSLLMRHLELRDKSEVAFSPRTKSRTSNSSIPLMFRTFNVH